MSGSRIARLVVLTAPLYGLRQSLPCALGCLRVNAACITCQCALGLTPLSLDRLVNMPVLAEHIALQPNGAFCAHGADADIAGPCTGDLANVGQYCTYLVSIRDPPSGHQILDISVDIGATHGVVIGTIPMRFTARLHTPGAVGIVRPRPALGVVPAIA